MNPIDEPTSYANSSSDHTECLVAIAKINGELRDFISEEVQSAQADMMTAIGKRDRAIRTLTELRQALKKLESQIEEQAKPRGNQAVNSDHPRAKRTREFRKVHGSALRNGIYRIFNAARDDDAACFLELQDDNSIKVVALDESSSAQMVSPHLMFPPHSDISFTR
jgi:hypothetical protein